MTYKPNAAYIWFVPSPEKLIHTAIRLTHRYLLNVLSDGLSGLAGRGGQQRSGGGQTLELSMDGHRLEAWRRG